MVTPAPTHRPRRLCSPIPPARPFVGRLALSSSQTAAGGACDERRHRPGDGPDRGDHRARERGRSDRSCRADCEENGSAGLRLVRSERVLTARAEAERLERLAGLFQPAAAEPSEQLLRAVAGEQQPDRHAGEQAEHPHAASVCSWVGAESRLDRRRS